MNRIYDHAGSFCYCHFFDEESLTYFDAADFDEPTRWVAKALAVSLLYTGDEALWDEVVSEADVDLAGRLPQWLDHMVCHAMGKELLGKLDRWFRGDGPEANRSHPGADDCQWQQICIESAVDWERVAHRLRREVKQHRHRADKRALELSCGVPYSAISAQLLLDSSDGEDGRREDAAAVGRAHAGRTGFHIDQTG